MDQNAPTLLHDMLKPPDLVKKNFRRSVTNRAFVENFHTSTPSSNVPIRKMSSGSISPVEISSDERLALDKIQENPDLCENQCNNLEAGGNSIKNSTKPSSIVDEKKMVIIQDRVPNHEVENADKKTTAVSSECNTYLNKEPIVGNLAEAVQPRTVEEPLNEEPVEVIEPVENRQDIVVENACAGTSSQQRNRFSSEKLTRSKVEDMIKTFISRHPNSVHENRFEKTETFSETERDFTSRRSRRYRSSRRKSRVSRRKRSRRRDSSSSDWTDDDENDQHHGASRYSRRRSRSRSAHTKKDPHHRHRDYDTSYPNNSERDLVARGKKRRIKTERFIDNRPSKNPNDDEFRKRPRRENSEVPRDPLNMSLFISSLKDRYAPYKESRRPTKAPSLPDDEISFSDVTVVLMSDDLNDELFSVDNKQSGFFHRFTFNLPKFSNEPHFQSDCSFGDLDEESLPDYTSLSYVAGFPKYFPSKLVVRKLSTNPCKELDRYIRKLMTSSGPRREYTKRYSEILASNMKAFQMKSREEKFQNLEKIVTSMKKKGPVDVLYGANPQEIDSQVRERKKAVLDKIFELASEPEVTKEAQVPNNASNVVHNKLSHVEQVMDKKSNNSNIGGKNAENFEDSRIIRKLVTDEKNTDHQPGEKQVISENIATKDVIRRRKSGPKQKSRCNTIKPMKQDIALEMDDATSRLQADGNALENVSPLKKKNASAPVQLPGSKSSTRRTRSRSGNTRNSKSAVNIEETDKSVEVLKSRTIRKSYGDESKILSQDEKKEGIKKQVSILRDAEAGTVMPSPTKKNSSDKVMLEKQEITDHKKREENALRAGGYSSYTETDAEVRSGAIENYNKVYLAGEENEEMNVPVSHSTGPASSSVSQSPSEKANQIILTKRKPTKDEDTPNLKTNSFDTGTDDYRREISITKDDTNNYVSFTERTGRIEKLITNSLKKMKSSSISPEIKTEIPFVLLENENLDNVGRGNNKGKDVLLSGTEAVIVKPSHNTSQALKTTRNVSQAKSFTNSTTRTSPNIDEIDQKTYNQENGPDVQETPKQKTSKAETKTNRRVKTNKKLTNNSVETSKIKNEMDNISRIEDGNNGGTNERVYGNASLGMTTRSHVRSSTNSKGAPEESIARNKNESTGGLSIRENADVDVKLSKKGETRKAVIHCKRFDSVKERKTDARKDDATGIYENSCDIELNINQVMQGNTEHVPKLVNSPSKSNIEIEKHESIERFEHISPKVLDSNSGQKSNKKESSLKQRSSTKKITKTKPYELERNIEQIHNNSHHSDISNLVDVNQCVGELKQASFEGLMSLDELFSTLDDNKSSPITDSRKTDISPMIKTTGKKRQTQDKKSRKILNFNGICDESKVITSDYPIPTTSNDYSSGYKSETVMQTLVTNSNSSRVPLPHETELEETNIPTGKCSELREEGVLKKEVKETVEKHIIEGDDSCPQRETELPQSDRTTSRINRPTNGRRVEASRSTSTEPPIVLLQNITLVKGRTDEGTVQMSRNSDFVKTTTKRPAKKIAKKTAAKKSKLDGGCDAGVRKSTRERKPPPALWWKPSLTENDIEKYDYLIYAGTLEESSSMEKASNRQKGPKRGNNLGKKDVSIRSITTKVTVETINEKVNCDMENKKTGRDKLSKRRGRAKESDKLLERIVEPANDELVHIGNEDSRKEINSVVEDRIERLLVNALSDEQPSTSSKPEHDKLKQTEGKIGKFPRQNRKRAESPFKPYKKDLNENLGLECRNDENQKIRTSENQEAEQQSMTPSSTISLRELINCEVTSSRTSDILDNKADSFSNIIPPINKEDQLATINENRAFLESIENRTKLLIKQAIQEGTPRVLEINNEPNSESKFGYIILGPYQNKKSVNTLHGVFYFSIEGSCKLTVGDEVIPIKRGYLVPKEIPCVLQNTSDRVAILVYLLA